MRFGEENWGWRSILRTFVRMVDSNVLGDSVGQEESA